MGWHWGAGARQRQHNARVKSGDLPDALHWTTHGCSEYTRGHCEVETLSSILGSPRTSSNSDSNASATCNLIGSLAAVRLELRGTER
eukprot:2929446-Pyramimonas_sp.AAC.1